MDNPHQKALDRLPQVLEKNAPGMMRRMVARMKDLLAAPDVAARASHGVLFLKVGEEDLVREFLEATTAAFVRNEPTDFASLQLEPEGGKPQYPEFTSSDEAFDRLCDTGAHLRIRGFERYDKVKFLGVLADAFARARMDARATHELLPYARAALNAELQVLYTKLDQLFRQSPGA